MDATLLISLPRRLRRDVERLAEREGMSLSAVGRRAVEAYVDSENPSSGSLGRGRRGP